MSVILDQSSTASGPVAPESDGVAQGVPALSLPPARVPRPAKPRRDSKDKGRKQRRSSEIHGYVGPNGSGKSAAMIFDTLPTLDGVPWECYQTDHLHCDPITDDDGNFLGFGPNAVFTGVRRVLSTVPLYDSETGELHPLYDRFDAWPKFLEAEHTDVVMDEVMGWFSSRAGTSGLPEQVEQHLQKLRHYDDTLRWTSPSWKRAHILLREVTKAVTDCRGHFGTRVPGQAWVQNRMFKWRTFPTLDYEEFTSGERDRIGKGSPVAWVYGPGSRMFASYDTLGSVTTIGSFSRGGSCIRCGGARAAPRCQCH